MPQPEAFKTTSPPPPKPGDIRKRDLGPKRDMVVSPDHYTTGLADLGIEVIDISNALKMNGNRFSILRYVTRAGLKDPAKEIEEMEKIKMYAEFEIRLLKNEPISDTRRTSND